MNALEWEALTGAGGRWRALARAVETPEGGLEAVFDDAGRRGLAFAPADARGWDRWRAALAAAGLGRPAAARPGRAWLLLDDDRAAEAWTSAARLERRAPGAAPASAPAETRTPPRCGVPELDAVLAAVHGLHPLSGLRLGLGRLEARLAAPAPWPLFAVLDAAKPFEAKAAVWAARLGSRGVAGFALAAGRMELFIS